MPHRYIVMEAFIHKNEVRMQLLNFHQSASGAFWYYTPNYERLKLISLKTGQMHSWQECEQFMMVEQLERIAQEKRVESTIQFALHAGGYIGTDGGITAKGREFLAQYAKDEPTILLSNIVNVSKVSLNGN